MKILIIDDAAFMRMTLRNIVEQNNMLIVGEAEDGAMGVEQYKQYHPDVVIMDISMPIMDGIEAIRQIKDYDKYAKILVCTSMGQQFITRKALEAGAGSYIVKPFEEKKVIEAIERLMSVNWV